MTTGKEIKKAVKLIWGASSSRRVFLFMSIAIFILLYMLPVWTTPGNDIAFHFSLLPTWIFLLMILLSILNGLLLAMQWHIRGVKKKAGQVAKESATLLGILGSALAATIACAACYTSLLAIFGLGATAFVAENQALFAVIALGLTLVALHYTSKRVTGVCTSCQVTL